MGKYFTPFFRVLLFGGEIHLVTPQKKEKRKQSQTYTEHVLEKMTQSHHILTKS